ncbi:UDP-glucuronic acid decarboxylase family protein [Methanobacterium sp.]|uniref:UDP-glucuronic acid decarboxylase family protein n=1 Tax=Methanobacterium sp. TaxID=2164 RepID=UPI0025D8D7B5|nr:UDP-glucuronic acid decarboxylase family protein [Methanobacterium sp.]MBI5458141.1 SDR family oxidoreductase [Methanobacterium sp.]
MKQVLISGAAGFIGSHLCDKFLEEGFYVVGLDNFITGSPKNIEHLLERKKFEFIKHDITLPIKFHSKKIDLVLHFACPASPVDYLKFPLETMKVNSIGTLNMLEIAKKYNSKYIFASTSEVYGDPTVHPQTESYLGNVNPVGPRSVYDESKRFSEAISMSYFREYGLDTRIIRIFNTYGPRMKANDGRVVPNFITQALNMDNITVYGNGNQTRSFCYISDLIDGIFKITSADNLKGEIMNLGNPEEYNILDLAKIIIEKTSSKSQIIFKALPEDDPKQRCPEITKIKKLTKWQPETSLKEGIDLTIDYFKNHI